MIAESLADVADADADASSMVLFLHQFAFRSGQ